jgi:5-methyltetrahydropteroyltriglutamate--homocysteine methyltransferase
MDAFERHERGELAADVLRSFMDDAVKIAIKEQEVTGIDMVSDGEQRRYSFLAIVGEKLGGSFEIHRITELAARNPEAQEIIERMQLPKSVPQPVAVRKIARSSPIAVDEYQFAKEQTARPIKVALPSPYLLMWNSWDYQHSKEAYGSPEDLGWDLARVLREEIMALKQAGAKFVQLDDPAIQHLLDPQKYMRFLKTLLGHEPKSAKEELDFAVRLINETVKGIDGVRIGFHVCRGNWPAPQEILPRGDYSPILPGLVELKTDQLVLEFATPRAGPVDVFKDYAVDMELGLGVIDVKDHNVESEEQVASRVEAALRYFDPEDVWLNPDCGFASGRTWPVADRRTAMRKLTVMARAAEALRKKYA